MTGFYNEELINNILTDRYFSNGEQSWTEVAHRVSRYVASAGVVKGLGDAQIIQTEKFYEALLMSRIFLPNSPTLFNAGVNTNLDLMHKPLAEMTTTDYEDIYASRVDNGCLSACFVVPVEDSMKGIYKSLSDAALITKSGGGVGFSFSRLRPKGSMVGGTGGFSSGPVAFMEVFDKSAHVVRQGGRRRAAMMAILKYDHPDILNFIHSKKNNDGTSVLSYFNISVDIDPDKFIQLYEDDGVIVLTHEHTGQAGEIGAREFLGLIAENAWRSGDPGMVFTSRHNQYSPISNIVTFESTNPCGEQYLQPFGSCNLGSIDLAKINDKNIHVITRLAVDFLDDVVDINHFPLPELDIVNRYNRDIGLGVMGVHDALIKAGIPYDSTEGRIWVAQTIATIALESYTRSMDNAAVFGSAPAFEHSRFKDDGFVPFRMMDIPELDVINNEIRYLMNRIRQVGIRNMSIGSIAPTGTISLLAETSSGIEPNFAFSYNRTMIDKTGERVDLRIKPQSIEGFDGYDDAVLAETGSLRAAYISNPDGYVPKTAQEINYIDHILMQAAAQAYISNSVSKTINLANSATVEDVRSAYLIAMRSGCKGVTVYRDGSLSAQILEVKRVPERDEDLKGVTRVHNEDGKKTYVTVNFHEDGTPAEVFITGETRVSVLIGRMVSMAFRAGVYWKDVIEQLNDTGGYASEIGDTIYDIINGSNGHSGNNDWVDTNKGFSVNADGDTKCDACDGINVIVMQSGCVSCSACGYTACNI